MVKNNNETSHSKTVGSSEKEDKEKRKRIFLIVLSIVAIIAVVIAAWYTYKKQDDSGESQGETAETITQEDTPSAKPGDKGATTITETLPNGKTKTRLKAPDHISGIPDDVAVDRGLAEHDPDEPIPAGPSEGIKPTLTAPTTPRVSKGGMEAPDMSNPAVGDPETLAKSFANSSFSLCIKPENSYNKNMREKYGHLVTNRLKKKGFSWGGNDHSEDWDAYRNPIDCNVLTSFPSINNASIGGKDTIYYDVTVNQRVTMKTTKGGTIATDVPGFRGMMAMKYVNGKWLVDDFQILGGKMPTVH